MTELEVRAVEVAKRAGAAHADAVVETGRNFGVQVNDGAIGNLAGAAVLVSLYRNDRTTVAMPASGR